MLPSHLYITATLLYCLNVAAFDAPAFQYSIQSILESGFPAAGDGANVLQALSSLGLDLTDGVEVLTSISGYQAPGCSYACSTLAAFYNGSVTPRGSFLYHQFRSAFWAQQQGEVAPYCIFRPLHISQLPVALLLSRLAECPFALKSGGHAGFAGASSIDDGMTIDLGGLKSISLSEDKKVACIGTGNTWYDVYTALEEHNLAVVGGRVSGVGVGGLTLGGGVSFFSNMYGWACDNVINYELVTAGGSIINSNQTSYPDLYWALRGGGNNFGIVTRFDLLTFPQGMMWGGFRFYGSEHAHEVIDAFVGFGFNSAMDPNAALVVPMVWIGGLLTAAVNIQYALPVADPPIFDKFKAIPSFRDTSGIKTLANITEEFAELTPNGQRQESWAAAYKLDSDLAIFIVKVFVEEFTPVENATGLIPSCVLQIITTDQLSHMSNNGGNALGLSASDGPLILLNLEISYMDPLDDKAIQRVCARIIERTVAQAKAWGLDHDFVYQNYASEFQEVFPTYGRHSFHRLRQVAQKYDPAQVFQKLQPGYFKLL
ncbi:MAG: hypothetical protein M1819_006242 [Sarea resinae]|nr:MAG: hypothetical protein M1819_006242 [Sarea resinae]